MRPERSSRSIVFFAAVLLSFTVACAFAPDALAQSGGTLVFEFPKGGPC